MVRPRGKLAASSDASAPIVAAATRLFAAHGFDGTTVQDVADTVGLTKPAVLHHFASKEQLREAVLRSILDHWNQALPRLLLKATASEARFDAVFDELFDFFASDPDRARVLVREGLDRPEETKRLLRGPVQPWLQAIARYIHGGQKTGEHYDDVDPEAYVVHILQLVLIATASSEVTQAAITKDARRRYTRELARIAKAALFPKREKPSSRRTPRQTSKTKGS